jgi:sulfonate transport system permease protein
MMRIVKRPLATVVFWAWVIMLVLLAEYAVRTRLVSPAVFASPSEIVSAVPSLLRDGFISDVLDTVRRAVLGTLLGFPLGVVMALGIYSLGRARPSAEFMLDFVRSIPITALIPVFLAIYGVGEGNKVAIGTASALLVTSITVLIGLKEGTSQFSEMIFIYRPRWYKRMKHIIIPSAIDHLAAALRLAVSSSLVLVVVAEMFIGTNSGIGYVINNLAYGDNRPGQYAAVLTAGVIGFALNAVFSAIQIHLSRILSRS